MPRRSIDTGIWSDERVSDLTAPAQLVYLRVILGDDTGPAGATQVHPKRIAVDTNLPREQVDAALTELVAAGLVRQYPGGWLWLPAFIRYQLSGPQFIRGIRRQAADAPEQLRKDITRALEAIIGPGTEEKAEKRTNRTATSNGEQAETKVATSREESDSPPTVDRQTTDEPASDGGVFEREVQDQDQDQDQDRPTVWSVLCPSSENEEADEAATPAPAPGAQAPPPERDTPARRPRRGPAPDVPHGELIPLAELMRTAPPAFMRPRTAPELTA